MRIHNIHFYHKIRKFLYKIFLNIYFLDQSGEFPRDSKMSSNQMGKRNTSVRVTEVLL